MEEFIRFHERKPSMIGWKPIAWLNGLNLQEVELLINFYQMVSATNTLENDLCPFHGPSKSLFEEYALIWKIKI